MSYSNKSFQRTSINQLPDYSHRISGEVKFLKHKRCSVTEDNGKATIGKGYWSDFMRRNEHRLNVVGPHQFVIDRNK